MKAHKSIQRPIVSRECAGRKEIDEICPEEMEQDRWEGALAQLEVEALPFGAELKAGLLADVVLPVVAEAVA